MQIPKEALEEFKEIYKKQFGVELSDGDTHKNATAILSLMEAVYKPVRKTTLEKIKKENRS